MRAQQVTTITSELQELLLEEHKLLKAGKAADTIKLTDRKQTLMGALNQIMNSWAPRNVPPAQVKAISDIQGLAKKNSLHFEAVRNGLRSLIERIDSNSENTRIGAYDQYGNQMKFQRSEGGYKKSV